MTPSSGGKRSPCLAVRHELERRQQALAANVSDQRLLLGQAAQPREQVVALARRILDQAVALQDAQHREGRG